MHYYAHVCLYGFFFSKNEQMVRYFGRHPAKQFIKGKPIRFGFKLWSCCSADGFCYNLDPYAGACSENDPNYGLGENVVLRLLKIVSEPSEHTVTMDNFFMSHRLICKLNKEGFFATGTVRADRTNHAPLKEMKDFKKAARGEFDTCFDKNNSAFFVRWKDNSTVTVVSNHIGCAPLGTCKRFDRKEHKFKDVPQPDMIKHYNETMGGTDAHDNAVNAYRITVGSKKWYWCLITTLLDSCMTNAWKLQCLFKKKLVLTKITSQLEFRVEITKDLLVRETLNSAITRQPSIQNSIRFDGINHVPLSSAGRQRCKVCHNHTNYVCNKCKTFLHIKCFPDYHNAAQQ